MVTDERTLQERTQKREREEGKMVPVAAVMDMKVSASCARGLSSTCPASVHISAGPGGWCGREGGAVGEEKRSV